jgi:hypothetical protein
MAKYEAGQHARGYIEAAGRPHYLYLQIGWGQTVTIHNVAYVKAPGVGKPAEYGPVGQPGYPALTVFTADQPGPFKIADDVAVVSFEYSANEPFVAFFA